MPLMTMPTREQMDPEVRRCGTSASGRTPRSSTCGPRRRTRRSSSATCGASCWSSSAGLGGRPSLRDRHRRRLRAQPLSLLRVAPRAAGRGRRAHGRAGRIARALTLEPLAEDHDFPPRAGFAIDDSLVIDLAYFLVWSGIYPHAADVHPRVVQRLRRRLLGRLREHFSERQVEELTWRIVQCVAFNWHNDFFELDLEPEVAPRETAVERQASRV